MTLASRSIRRVGTYKIFTDCSGAIAEKLEGLAWGSDLADGRHVLYVVSDNDLNPNLATQIYAFAIDASLLDFEQQFLPVPVFVPR